MIYKSLRYAVPTVSESDTLRVWERVGFVHPVVMAAVSMGASIQHACNIGLACKRVRLVGRDGLEVVFQPQITPQIESAAPAGMWRRRTEPWNAFDLSSRGTLCDCPIYQRTGCLCWHALFVLEELLDQWEGESLEKIQVKRMEAEAVAVSAVADEARQAAERRMGMTDQAFYGEKTNGHGDENDVESGSDERSDADAVLDPRVEPVAKLMDLVEDEFYKRYLGYVGRLMVILGSYFAGHRMSTNYVQLARLDGMAGEDPVPSETTSTETSTETSMEVEVIPGEDPEGARILAAPHEADMYRKMLEPVLGGALGGDSKVRLPYVSAQNALDVITRANETAHDLAKKGTAFFPFSRLSKAHGTQVQATLRKNHASTLTTTTTIDATLQGGELQNYMLQLNRNEGIATDPELVEFMRNHLYVLELMARELRVELEERDKTVYDPKRYTGARAGVRGNKKKRAGKRAGGPRSTSAKKKRGKKTTKKTTKKTGKAKGHAKGARQALGASQQMMSRLEAEVSNEASWMSSTIPVLGRKPKPKPSRGKSKGKAPGKGKGKGQAKGKGKGKGKNKNKARGRSKTAATTTTKTKTKTKATMSRGGGQGDGTGRKKKKGPTSDCDTVNNTVGSGSTFVWGLLPGQPSPRASSASPRRSKRPRKRQKKLDV